MKILHVATTLSSGGAELHLLTLCRYLKKHGVEVVVACLSEYGKGARSLRTDFEGEGVRVICVGDGHRFELRSFFRIARLVQKERPDILHTHLPRADLVGAFARYLSPSVVWVCSVHGIYSESWSARWSLPLFNHLWRRADVVLCISHAVRDWLVGRGLPLHKAAVIHYGIEPNRFFEFRDNLRERWGVEDSTVIGTIGRLEPGKNHECLIAAMPGICEAVPNALLLIAGHDSWGYGSTLRRRIDELGLNEKVRLVGFQTDVAAFLGALDVFAFATKSEGFGQVVVEAMAAGKPVVASKIAPLTEIIDDRETGFLVESDSPQSFAGAVIQLLLDPLERHRIGACARERVTNYFTAHEMTQRTLLLYENLLAQRSELRSMACDDLDA